MRAIPQGLGVPRKDAEKTHDFLEFGISLALKWLA